ncbi:MAG TPA: YcaO-like family protein [Polyangiaceae bacterium]|nr:YcaO-like family protein [Polyangiaceae bacterium]
MADDAHSLELEALRATCPLPAGWQLTAPLFDAASVPGLRLNLVGLLARAEDGREALGSAGALGELPIARAYFELFERIAVLEALARPRERYAAWRADGERESLTFAEVFPEAPAGADFQYSRSNGVAAGPSFQQACEAAAAELVERDRLLRAWYGQVLPVRCSLPDDLALTALEPWYEFEAYSFPFRVQRAGELSVAAIFGFPKRAEAPLVFGTAAGTSLKRAFDGALRECLQRWGFLWGERIPSAAPSFSPTADYHQEFFLWPAMHATVRDFLSGAHSGLDRLCALAECGAAPLRFVDLSPATGARVARAVPGPGAELPLTFGRGHPSARAALPESLRVHLIA